MRKNYKGSEKFPFLKGGGNDDNVHTLERAAFTLAEALIVLVIIGTLMVISLTNGKKLVPDMDKTKCKKAYNQIESTVYHLIADTDKYIDDKGQKMYSDAHGFADTRTYTTAYGEIFGADEAGLAKFRDAFIYDISATKTKITCDIFNGSAKETSNTCFKTSDGIVYGIPDTNFADQGIKTVNGMMYAPITVYTNFAKNSTMESGAFFTGVRYNGEIILLTDITADCKTNPDYIQCRAQEFLDSKSLRKEAKKGDKDEK